MGLWFEEIEVGSSFTTDSHVVTEEDIDAFAALTGDQNPLHVDQEFATKSLYGARVAHGQLILSLAIGLMSRTGFVIGTALGFLEIERWRFLAPVRIGDRITVTFTVTGKRDSSKRGRGIVIRSVRVLNQRGEDVQVGTTVILVRARQ